LIDLHIHVLPGVDDGSPSVAVTRAMLLRAHALGFGTLVATPHLPRQLDGPYAAAVNEALTATRQIAAGIGVEVRLGFEAALTRDLPCRLARGEPVTLGGSSAVLVDLPFAVWPLHAETSLFALQTAGYRPVLAHPERYAEVQRDPQVAVRLAERGILLQVTIGSLAGMLGRAARRTAEELLRRGAVHVVATDGHSAGERYAGVSPGLARLTELMGTEGVRRLVVATPRALLDGTALPDPPAPVAAGRRAWFRRG